jgi:cellulose synthase (UDP-forming)
VVGHAREPADAEAPVDPNLTPLETASSIFGEAPAPVATEGLGAARIALVAAFLAAAGLYLVWRPGSFNPDALAFSITVYAAEVFGFATALLHLFMSWRLTVREAPPANPGRSVDVFVTSYDEPVEMVRRTLLAARTMDYPHQTWLLDDGNRPEMRRLAAELGCRYIARRVNTDAKAGNLNNALLFSTAELVAVFDADHAPAREFLTETVGYLEDPNVAFVQTPQDFYNLDSYQHRRGRGRCVIWTEQSLFFRVIQRGKDHRNAAFFCGSCAVLRRAALDKVGGFAASTVTEDLHTSIRLHKAGFRSVYHARSLAFGLAPANVVSFLRQRMRWGLGAMQVWRRERLLTSRRLSAAQKLCYLASILTYFDGWAKAVFYFAPVVVLVSGVMPLAVLDEEFWVRFLPYYLLGFWVYEEVGRGFGHTLELGRYNMARFAAYIWATFGLARKRARFRVTEKALGLGAATRRYLGPQYLVLLTNAAAIPLGAALYAAEALPVGALAANIVWAGLNVWLAASVVNFSLRVGGFRRRDYRFLVPIPVRVRTEGARPVLGVLDDVSSSGFRFYGPIPDELRVGARLEGDLFLPAGRLPFRAVVRTAQRADGGTRVKCIGCRFDWADDAERDQLDLHLYGSDMQWQLNGLAERGRTLLERLATLVGRPAPAAATEPAAHWAPVLYHAAAPSAEPPRVGLVSVPGTEGEPRTLVTLLPLDPTAQFRFRMVTRTGSFPLPGQPVPVKNIATPAAPVYVYQFAA